MKRRQLLSIGLALVMTLSLAACGGATGASTSGSEPAAAATEAEAAPEETAEGEAAPEESADAKAAPAESTEGEADSAPAQSAGEEIAAGDISVKWDDSHVYTGTSLGNYSTITTYEVKRYEDVPFIKASDYLHAIYEGKEKTEMQGDVMTINVNGTTGTIDAAADTITMEDPGKFRDIGLISGGVISKSEFNTITPSIKNPSTETAPQSLTVSLKDYNMPVIAYDGDILMPFLALQNSVGNVAMQNVLAYNGKDYFNVVEANNFKMDYPDKAKDSVYIKSIYSGPFSTQGKTTQAYADYNYYSTCMLLDISFGHKEEKNITTFDEYFTRINAKKSLCSTDPSAAMTAEILLFNYLFDSGHDSIAGTDTVFGPAQVDPNAAGNIAEDIKESEEGKELFEEEQKLEEGNDTADAILGALLEKGLKVPDVAPIIIWSNYMTSVKPADYGEQRLDFAGDTAVIFFSHFMDTSTERKPAYYMDGMTEEDAEKDNFAYFYNCFKEIQQHEEVKNVVINLSDNGGGAAAGLINVLGFLSEDGEACFTNRDMVTGSYREEWYHVDTNLDGVADDQDGFGGQYDFYIMCSGSSYSCGTALPYLAQQSGTAKIIGAQPGGGDCVVGTFVDAYGRYAVFSGMMKIGKETESGFVSDEKATTLDYNMMPSLLDIGLVPWFDANGIAEAVHNCQNGETVASYSEEEEGEQISKFFESLFGQMGDTSTQEQ